MPLYPAISIALYLNCVPSDLLFHPSVAVLPYTFHTYSCTDALRYKTSERAQFRCQAPSPHIYKQVACELLWLYHHYISR